MRYGSLFSGYGGLDLAVEAHYGATAAWHCELDPHASKVLAARWDAPNLGDITAVDWSRVEPVDVLTGGFPCQDISTAGLGAGIKEGTRSGLWFRMLDAVRVLRPRLVVVENVRALVVRGLGTVVGDLAAVGYDAEWVSVRASDVGAPHRRERVFLTAGGGARPAADPGGERHGRGQDGGVVGRVDGPDAVGARQRERSRQVAGDRSAEAPAGGRHAVRADLGRHAHRRGDVDWGVYAAAIHRWEPIIGRSAPHPVDDRGRLSPWLVEWMMGLPEGWVCDVLDRRPALRCLGNGVVPQQAVYALGLLDGIRADRRVAA